MLNDDLRYLLRQIGKADMEQIKKAAVVLCANEAAKAKAKTTENFVRKQRSRFCIVRNF